MAGLLNGTLRPEDGHVQDQRVKGEALAWARQFAALRAVSDDPALAAKGDQVASQFKAIHRNTLRRLDELQARVDRGRAELKALRYLADLQFYDVLKSCGATNEAEQAMVGRYQTAMQRTKAITAKSGVRL